MLVKAKNKILYVLSINEFLFLLLLLSNDFVDFHQSDQSEEGHIHSVFRKFHIKTHSTLTP